MLLATGCLADRCLDGEAVRDLLAALGLDRVVLVAHEHATPSRLRGLPTEAVRIPLEEAERGVELARAAGARRLVLELDHEATLEATSRRLFALGRAHPGLRLELLTPAAGDLADAETLGLLVEDVGGDVAGYWHRPAQIQARGGDQVAWLDRLGRHLKGASLDDLAAGELGLPPGLGDLDLEHTARLLGKQVEPTLDTAPLPEPRLLTAAVENLRAAGFP